MSYYTFSSKDIEKKMNAIQYGSEAASIIEKLEAEIEKLQAALTKKTSTPATEEAIAKDKQNDQSRVFLLGWRAAEAFHQITGEE